MAEKDVALSVRNAESIILTLKNIVSEAAGGVSSSDFQHILTTSKHSPAAIKIKHLYDMQTSDIIRDSHDMIDNMYNDTKIDGKYNGITQLLKDSDTKKNYTAWRPCPGNCDMQLQSMRKRSLIEKKNKLEKLTLEERNRRTQMKKTLDHRRAHVQCLLENIKLAQIKLHRNIGNDI